MSSIKRFTTWISILLMIFLCFDVMRNRAFGSGVSEADKIGTQCDELVTKQYCVLQNEAVRDSVQRIAVSLAEKTGKILPNLQVTVLNEPIPNIFSFPNHIYITSGLLDTLESRGELTLVLAREIDYLSGQTQYAFYSSERGKRSMTGGIMIFLTVASVAASIAIPLASMATMSATVVTPQAFSAYTQQIVTQFSTALALEGGALFLANMSDLSFAGHGQELRSGILIDNQIASMKRQASLAKQQGKIEAHRRLSQDVARLSVLQEQYIGELRQKNPMYASFRYPQPVSLSQVPLTPQEYLLRYKVTDSALLAWLIKDGKLVHTETVPVIREVLRQKVQNYLAAFQQVSSRAQLAKYDVKESNELYTLLFKPMADKITERSHVIIVPDDVLEVLPFESLVSEIPAGSQMQQGKFGPFPSGAKFLADRYQVSYYYSATAMSLARQLKKSVLPSQSLFMMADPSGSPGGRVLAQSKSGETVMSMAKKEGWTSLEGQFEPLPRARELSEKLKQLYPDGRFLVGESATKDNLSGIEENRYVVFATHGILAREIPYIEEPALLLYPEGGADNGIRPKGFLTMSEVMKLNLTCDNASLTACSTGLGHTSGGEGVMSMGWAFQYAGAKSVLVSLWNVDEKSSVLLAAKYFENLKAGKNRMTALSDARTEIRKMGYEHPFYWAPFILIGETN